ncbi:hypothetical protein [Streptomyces rubiginosohelvolus]|uniref:hypothetical protein n=1 Tax=Streptomyces rubiginosohelvolus TaxID=67362 RepID=UPI0037A8AE5F
MERMRTRKEHPTGSTPTPISAPSSPPPRWAVRAAQLITLLALPTGLWRLAMVCGFPSGYTEAGFVPFDTPGSKLWMLTLTVACELLALLSLGLVRPWGETVPRWIPVIGGRPVRPLAAVVPAAAGALALTAIWAAMPLWWTYPHTDMTPTGRLLVGVIYQPLVLWGPLLGAVTVSYHRRTKGSRTAHTNTPCPANAATASEPMATVVAPGHSA